MIGSLINGGAILGGGLIGRLTARNLPPVWEHRAKMLLGLATLYAGAAAVWHGVGGDGFAKGTLRIFALAAALVAGRWLGAAIRIQDAVNRAGRYARERVSPERADQPVPGDQAFLAGAAVFCLAPLALVGPLLEGLFADLKPLLIKSVMDGLAMVTLGRTLGWGVLASALPVVAGQGSIALWARLAAPSFAGHPAAGGLAAAAGFVLLAVALVILGTARIRMADYLPALALAPLCFWLIG